jgi:cytochrome oxidase Cu insertion factor (SCO1/SenC/PrrC family)
MMMRAVVRWSLLAGIAAGAASGAAGAQSPHPDSTQSPAQTPYTLQVNSRVVLTDVTVTDKHGNPVRG